MDGKVVDYVPASHEVGDLLLAALDWWMWEQGSKILSYDDDVVDGSDARYYRIPVSRLQVYPPIPWRRFPVVEDGVCRVDESHVMAMSSDDWDLVTRISDLAVNAKWVSRAEKNVGSVRDFYAGSSDAYVESSAAMWERLGGMEESILWVKKWVYRQWVLEVSEAVARSVASGAGVMVRRCDEGWYSYLVDMVWMDRGECDLLAEMLGQVGVEFSVSGLVDGGNMVV